MKEPNIFCIDFPERNKSVALMTEVKIELLDEFKDELFNELDKFSSKNSVHYADARIELSEAKAASCQNADIKGAYEDYGIDLGVRVYVKGNGLLASGMAGTSMGIEQLKKEFKKTLNELLNSSLKKAKHSLIQKQKLKNSFSFLSSLKENNFLETEVHKDTVKYEFKKNPRNISLDELISLTQEQSKKVKEINGIASNVIGLSSGFERKLFASSEGALIDQTWPLTEAFFFAVAKGKAMESYYESIGERLGLEVFDGVNGFRKSLDEFTSFIAEGTIELSNAKAVKEQKNTSIVTDAWFNSLLVHEICGHPIEADRALKREAAWAGRAWWFNSIEDNMFGKKVASDLVTVFSDSSLEGYGKFKYDDEGTKARKSINIKNGILNEFLNSRETAAILGQPANSAVRATTASAVPLIRMTNTCFDKGKWNKDEIIQDTKEGYYLIGRKIPSIGETRQNFKITCWKAYKIEKGELTTLYRKGGLQADSFSYLSSIDAVGKDFGMFNVPNCGKGTPMQVMKLGNGSPTMRAIGRITGGELFV
ncbi:MAG: TldD/PmbA family protein [Candidatus Diapherotrites archaeon]